MSSVIKQIIKSFRRKKEVPKHLEKSENVLPRNIYGYKKMKNLAKNFNLFHYVFKYKFFVPILIISRKMLSKINPYEKLELDQHVNLKIFNESFEQALKVWTDEWYYEVYKNKKSGPVIKTKFYKNGPSQKNYRTMKEIFLIGSQHDTATLELANILMHKIAENMFKYYKDKSTEHIFYTSKSMSDFRYFMFNDKLKKGDVQNEKEKTNKS